MGQEKSNRLNTQLRVTLFADTDAAAYALFAPLGTKAQAALLRKMLSAALGEAPNSVMPLALERTATATQPLPLAKSSVRGNGGSEQDTPSGAGTAASLPELPTTLRQPPVPSQPPPPQGSGLWAAFSAGLEDTA